MCARLKDIGRGTGRGTGKAPSAPFRQPITRQLEKQLAGCLLAVSYDDKEAKAA